VKLVQGSTVLTGKGAIKTPRDLNTDKVEMKGGRRQKAASCRSDPPYLKLNLLGGHSLGA
jgi:hypothetical protein